VAVRLPERPERALPLELDEERPAPVLDDAHGLPQVEALVVLPLAGDPRAVEQRMVEERSDVHRHDEVPHRRHVVVQEEHVELAQELKLDLIGVAAAVRGHPGGRKIHLAALRPP
jgi:hypothetical protein